jgi:hypothetical protein
MPISFLQDRHRIQRIGRIRLGHKEAKRRKDGTEVAYPVADPFFLVPDELKATYGEHPTALNICLYSDDLEAVFPHYLRRYTASCLRCLGDGDNIIYAVNDQGQVSVRDYCAVGPDGKVLMTSAGPTRVSCQGEECPHYQSGACKPTGFLRFIVTEHARMGYYDIVCHQKAVITIKTQLQLALSMFGRLMDIPFVLHRGDEETVAVKTPKGIVNMPVRTQWIEIEPTWFQANVGRTGAVLAESQQRRRLLAAVANRDLYGEDVLSNEERATIAEFEQPTFEGEDVEAETVDVEQEAIPEPQAESPAPVQAVTPTPAESIRARLTEHAGKFGNGRQPSDAQIQLLAGKVQEALQDKDDKRRHLIYRYLWGRDSGHDLTYGQVGAMLKWLIAGQDGQTGDYRLNPKAVVELAIIDKAAQVTAGQTELPLLDDDEADDMGQELLLAEAVPA